MPAYEVTIEGKKYRVESQQPLSEQQAYQAALQQTQQSAPMKPGLLTTASLTMTPTQRAIAEPAMALASGAVGSMVGLLRALPTRLARYGFAQEEPVQDPNTGEWRRATPEDSGQRAFQQMQETAQYMTYVPRSPEGQAVMGAVSAVAEPIFTELDHVLTEGKWIPGWEGTKDPYLSEWIKTGFGALTGGTAAKLARTPTRLRALEAMQGSGFRAIPGEVQARAGLFLRQMERFGGAQAIARYVNHFNRVRSDMNAVQALGIKDALIPNQAAVQRALG